MSVIQSLPDGTIQSINLIQPLRQHNASTIYIRSLFSIISHTFNPFTACIACH